MTEELRHLHERGAIETLSFIKLCQCEKSSALKFIKKERCAKLKKGALIGLNTNEEDAISP